MASPRLLQRLDVLVWVLIFGGLLTLVLGIASHDETRIGGWSLTVLGALATAAGVVLIGVRARLSDQAGQAAQSNNKKQPEKKP